MSESQNKQLEELAGLWFNKMSKQVNTAVGMLMCHPDQLTAKQTGDTLSSLAFDMDRLLEEDYIGE